MFDFPFSQFSPGIFVQFGLAPVPRFQQDAEGGPPVAGRARRGTAVLPGAEGARNGATNAGRAGVAGSSTITIWID